MASVGRCVYCGAASLGRLACRAHADLPALDPHYAPELRRTTAEWLGPRAPARAAA